jgi:hypothetical protein
MYEVVALCIIVFLGFKLWGGAYALLVHVFGEQSVVPGTLAPVVWIFGFIACLKVIAHWVGEE